MQQWSLFKVLSILGNSRGLLDMQNSLSSIPRTAKREMAFIKAGGGWFCSGTMGRKLWAHPSFPCWQLPLPFLPFVTLHAEEKYSKMMKMVIAKQFLYL